MAPGCMRRGYSSGGGGGPCSRLREGIPGGFPIRRVCKFSAIIRRSRVVAWILGMVLRGAEDAGEAALMGLAAAAANDGARLAGAANEDDEVEDDPGACLSGEGSVAGEAGSDEAEGGGRQPAPYIRGGPRSAATTPSVSEELAAIAVAAHPVLGPKIVNALAESRGIRLERATVKFLEVHDADGTGPAWKQLRPLALGSGADPEAFRTLSAKLFADLGKYDEDFVPEGGGLYDAPTLLAALLELMELCEKPYNFPLVAAGTPGPSAQSGSELATALAALGASIGTALDGRLPKAAAAAAAEKKSEKMDLRLVLEKVEAFNTRPGGESVLELWEIANRTLLRRIHDHVVVAGVWPVDKELSPDAMAPFASPTGLFSATDEPSMELNAVTGKVEDKNRDPKAAVATSTEEYLGKVRLLFSSVALLLYGVKCGTAPHLVPGRERDAFCSLAACNEFLSFTATLGKVPLASLRSVMELTLRDIATAANARQGGRKNFTEAIRAGLKELKRRAEPLSLGLFAAAVAAPAPPAEPATPAAATKAAGEASLAELIATSIAAGLAKVGGRVRSGKGGGKPGKQPGGGKGAAERKKREREEEVEYDVGGTSTKRKPKRGGHDDAPRCQQRNHFKESWCAFSHAHM